MFGLAQEGCWVGVVLFVAALRPRSVTQGLPAPKRGTIFIHATLIILGGREVAFAISSRTNKSLRIQRQLVRDRFTSFGFCVDSSAAAFLAPEAKKTGILKGSNPIGKP
jgi:hypothetical protein